MVRYLKRPFAIFAKDLWLHKKYYGYVTARALARGSLVCFNFNKNKIINRMFGSISLASTKGFITHAHCAFRQMKPRYCISK